MKKSVILLVGWLLAFLWIGSADIWAQDAEIISRLSEW